MSEPTNGHEEFISIPEDLHCDLPEARPLPIPLYQAPIRRWHNRQPAVPRDLQPLDMVIVKEPNKTAWIGLYLTHKVSPAVPVADKLNMYILVPCQAKYRSVPSKFVKTLLEGIDCVGPTEVHKRDFDIKGAKTVLRELKCRASLFLLGQDIRFRGIPEHFIPESLQILAEIPTYMLHLRANGAHTMAPPLDEDVKMLDARKPVVVPEIPQDDVVCISWLWREGESVWMWREPVETPVDVQAPVEPPVKKSVPYVDTCKPWRVTFEHPDEYCDLYVDTCRCSGTCNHWPATFEYKDKPVAPMQTPVTFVEPPSNTRKRTVAPMQTPIGAQAPFTLGEQSLNIRKRAVTPMQTPVTLGEPPLNTRKKTVTPMQTPVTIGEPPLNTKEKTVTPMQQSVVSDATLGDEPPLKKQKKMTKWQPSLKIRARPKLLANRKVKRKLL